ncbi:MAG: hypothetical protein BWZ10_01845 [candidate division BRC1 bacterium ADurb.BinA364]|nr:MAG: hypothetical protein BWZ10_01845 [candidate division BRC1 bacterium ADurb.BinA364]
MPASIVSSSTAANLEYYEQAYRDSTPDGFLYYQREINSIAQTVMGAYFSFGFRFDRSISIMRKGLYQMLQEDLETESLRPTALKETNIFENNIPFRRGLLTTSERVFFETPFLESGDMEYGQTKIPAMHRYRISVFIWRMLRYLLKDEPFCRLIQDVMKEKDPITLERLQELAEKRYKDSLDWFFDHWFRGSGLPRYEILRAEARMVENPRTREIDYKVEIAAANTGEGKMPVPIMVQSERDWVERPVWLDSHSSATLSLLMPYRPEYVVIDPDGWIVQEAVWSPERKARDRPLKKVEILDD